MQPRAPIPHIRLRPLPPEQLPLYVCPGPVSPAVLRGIMLRACVHLRRQRVSPLKLAWALAVIGASAPTTAVMTVVKPANRAERVMGRW